VPPAFPVFDTSDDALAHTVQSGYGIVCSAHLSDLQNIGCSQLGHPMAFAPPLPAAREHVIHVLPMGSRINVRGLDASGHIAFVAAHFADWPRALVRDFPRNLMGLPWLAVYLGSAVAIAINKPEP
jgi:hypothetical protein